MAGEIRPGASKKTTQAAFQQESQQKEADLVSPSLGCTVGTHDGKTHLGEGQVRLALAARSFMVSPATVGRMMQAVRRRCPICRVRGGGHDQMSHLLRLDIASMGTDLPLEKPPSPPRRKRSKAAEQAVETAEGIVKRKLPDLGEFNSLLGPE